MSGGVIWEEYKSVSVAADIWSKVSGVTNTRRQSVAECGVACHNNKHSCNTFLYDQQHRECYHGYVVSVMIIQHCYDVYCVGILYSSLPTFGARRGFAGVC